MSLSHVTGSSATSAPLQLQRPPDNTRSYLVLAIGVATAVVIYMLTRSTLPHVGDNIHSLPHGGNYCDGTKSIAYNKPARNFPSSNLLGLAPVFLALALFAVTCPFVTQGPVNYTRRISICHQCGTAPSSSS